MTDAAATTHSSATIQQPHESQRQQLPHVPTAAAHDINHTHHCSSRAHTPHKRVRNNPRRSELRSRCEAPSPRAQHRRHGSTPEAAAHSHRCRIAVGLRAHVQPLLIQRHNTTLSACPRRRHSLTESTRRLRVHATHVQHLALSYTTVVSERGQCSHSKCPCTAHTTGQWTQHKSQQQQQQKLQQQQQRCSHGGTTSTLHTTRQHTAAPHLHATLATIARDATAARRRRRSPASSTQAAATALPSRRRARSWTSPTRRRRRQAQRGAADPTTAATAARATTPATRCAGGWPTATSRR
jgi:hypothetical protein